MGLGFSYRGQIIGGWDAARAALLAQLDEWTAAFGFLSPLVDNFRLPYPKSATLFTDSMGIPSLHVQARATVYRSTAQVVATATVTTLSFDRELFDVGDLWNPAFPTRLTVPIDGEGTYLVTAIVPWAASAAGTFRQIRIAKNGTGAAPFATVPVVGGAVLCQQETLLLPLIVSDYLEVMVLHDVGGNLNAGDGGNARIQFSAMKLAAA